MQKLIILQGIPGSGKSYWAKQFVKDNISFIRVSRDDLRNMRGNYWIPEQEELISIMEQNCVKSALKKGYNVILDATNLNSKYWPVWKDIASEYNVELEFKRFDTTLELCLDRDKNREESVGEGVIKNMYKNYLKVISNPPSNESFKVEKIIQKETFPRAIIVDLDGTLAIHNGRSPYEYSKIGEDSLNIPVANLIDLYQNTNAPKSVIYVSGREDICKDDTINWLKKYNRWGIATKLFMRMKGDYRKDYIVKKEIFDREIRDKYFIEFVLDDRNSVVSMWRKLGLTCLQVADGDF